MRNVRNWSVLIVFLIALIASVKLLTAGAPDTASVSSQEWPVYGGSPENRHYSPLAEINRANVKSLELAWTYDTGEKGGVQTSPLVVGGVLYGISPTQKIFAVDAATGKLLWNFDSGIKGLQPDRGLAYWSDGTDKRILVGVMNFLYALDAATGKPVPTFGTDGRVDLQENLGREARWQSISLTSPGVIYKDLIIVGGRNPKRFQPLPEMSALTRYAQESCDGHSTQFRIPENLDTKRGQKMHGRPAAPPTTGPG